MSKTSPFRRDWLGESYRIFKGDQKIKVKKEHVVAAMEGLIGLSENAETLRNLMKQAYTEACRRRQEQGLPIPPPPQGLNREFPKPWKN